MLKHAIVLALCAVLGGCATAQREERIDLNDALRRDMRDCGSDANCIRKRQAAQSRERQAPEASK